MNRTLKIDGLEVSLKKENKRVVILREINLSIGKNESFALAGESGSGKSMTAMSIMQLLPKNISATKGEICLLGKNVLSMNEKELQNIRGTDVGMIFQEPSSYLNPLFTVGAQIEEAIKDKTISKRDRVMEILEEVELKNSVYYQYPHQLSGGMQQRIMIAISLVNSPALLIADEPTTALDVTTAYGIIELIKKMMATHGLSVMFITHDISLAASFVKRIGIMYAGRLIEISDAQNILSKPLHPYTEKLVGCLPERYTPGDKIKTIEGTVPNFHNLPTGCPFHPRCIYKKNICTIKEPTETIIEGTVVRCFRYENSYKNS
ncbi:ABC transporter ATP-binding protein [bacterium]|nr:ABC transporter ATP-binding protein [bacterium]